MSSDKVPAVTRNDEKSSIISKSIAILEVMSQSARPVRFTEIIQRANLSKSSGHRILSVLTNEGMIAYDEADRTYRLGFRVMAWALKAWNDFDLPKVADEEMRWLNRQTDEHAVLAIIDGHEIVFLKKIESRAPIRMASKVGDRAPVYCTALGKAMAAFLPDQVRRDIIANQDFVRRTEKTITDAAAFESELAGVRARGYAVADQEETDEIRGLAAPIFDYQGNVAGAVNVWAHVFRIDRDTLIGWAPLVMEAAGRISNRLGHIRPE